MGKIQTHSHVKTAQMPNGGEPRFTLNALFPLSSNLLVRQLPKRVIVWGLSEGETVSVHMARSQSLGNAHWVQSGECCPCPIEPSAVANVAHMPYKKCKQAVVLTADEPAIHIDDTGNYYFEYHGTNEVVIEHFDDPIIAKNRLCDCEL